MIETLSYTCTFLYLAVLLSSFRFYYYQEKTPSQRQKEGQAKIQLNFKAASWFFYGFWRTTKSKNFPPTHTKFCLGTSLEKYLVFQVPSFNQIKPFEDLKDLDSCCWSHAQWSRHTILYNAQITLAYQNAEIGITSWCESKSYSEEVLHLVGNRLWTPSRSMSFFFFIMQEQFLQFMECKN